eukprot:9364461-Lingulodinium_polyedra.AAC.1
MDYKIAQYNARIEEPLKELINQITKSFGDRQKRTQEDLDKLRMEVSVRIKLTFATFQAEFERRHNESLNKFKEYVERYVKTALADIRKGNEQRLD